MKIKKLDFRVNLGVDQEFEKALDAARLSSRMTKTGYIRYTLLKDLIDKGFMPAKSMKVSA